MKHAPLPHWALPVLALAQVWLGNVAPLREPGAPWDAQYLMLAAIFGLVGLGIWVLAIRTCVILWRLPACTDSWSLFAVSAVVAAFAGLWATGPLTLGVWRWGSLAPGALALFLVGLPMRGAFRRLHGRQALLPKADADVS